MSLTPDELRSICLALPGSVEEFPFPRSPERSVFKVAGKVFAISSLSAIPLRVSLKCDPDEALHLRSTYAAIQPGYRLNKRHWNTLTLDDGTLPDRLVRELVEHSHELIVAALPRGVRDRFRT